MVAFILWSLAALCFLVIGVKSRISEKPARFWANIKEPEVEDVKKYNRDVSVLWLVFSILFEMIGIPLLFCEQNSPLVFVIILGVIALIVGLMIAYIRIEEKHKKVKK
ncbi:MAG: hypothetical protein SOT28_08525 [Fusicatenibacter sp.]|nr:hypothetical protein [Lachnospiraceae bacterium]MDY2938335.1 hypothetical protein [Fusicatenibacter sp.]